MYDDGIVKGMMSINRAGERGQNERDKAGTLWQLKELYVDPFFQGQGVGAALV